ncbi:putative N-acetyltransferase CgeE (plasmid) [Bacillus amyloliquefaciens]|nr:putative N-acetyltransferase CgeE [Bacillus amyloliquefaciens]
MTDQFAKTEKQYIELTSGIQRFEHYSVCTDPLLPQIFSHNFVQLHRTFPLDRLLPFLHPFRTCFKPIIFM